MRRRRLGCGGARGGSATWSDGRNGWGLAASVGAELHSLGYFWFHLERMRGGTRRDGYSDTAGARRSDTSGPRRACACCSWLRGGARRAASGGDGGRLRRRRALRRERPVRAWRLRRCSRWCRGTDGDWCGPVRRFLGKHANLEREGADRNFVHRAYFAGLHLVSVHEHAGPAASVLDGCAVRLEIEVGV